MQSKYQMVRDILSNNHGRFLTIHFVKKDGTLRRMNIQPAAIKFRLSVNPSPSSIQASAARSANHPNLVPVYDVKAKAVRSINVDTIQSIRANKFTFNVEK